MKTKLIIVNTENNLSVTLPIESWSIDSNECGRPTARISTSINLNYLSEEDGRKLIKSLAL